MATTRKSPTQLSIDFLLADGCQLVQKVEVWNPWARKRKDLFDCWDILAVKDGQTIAVQTTSRGNISARARKIADSESTAHLRRAGWVLLVHGWDKDKATKESRLKVLDVS